MPLYIIEESTHNSSECWLADFGLPPCGKATRCLSVFSLGHVMRLSINQMKKKKNKTPQEI